MTQGNLKSSSVGERWVVMRRWWVAVALSAVFVFTPLTVRGFQADRDVTIQLEDRLRFEYFSNYDFNSVRFADDEFYYLWNSFRFDLRALGKVFFSFQFDTRGFPEHLYKRQAPGRDDGFDPIQITRDDFYNLEKISLTLRLDGGELRLGDFHLTLNRGLGLSFRKEDDINFNRTLRGVLGKATIDRTRWLVFAGISNILNIDPVTYTHREDPLDLFAGAQLSVEVIQGLNVSLNALGAFYGVFLPEKDRRFLRNGQTAMLGGEIEAAGVVPYFDLYFSGVALLREEFEPDFDSTVSPMPTSNVAHTGYGLYGSVLFAYEPVTLLVEGKFYQNFRMVRDRAPLNLDRAGPDRLRYEEDLWYNYAPTLLPLDTEMQNNQDAGGIRIKLASKIPGTNLLLYFDTIYQQTAGLAGEPGDPLDDEEKHFYGGAEYHIARHHLQLEGGYWDDYYTDRRVDPNTGEVTERKRMQIRVAKLRFVGKFHLPMRFGLETDLRWRRKSETADGFQDEIDAILTVSTPWKLKVSAFLGVEAFEEEGISDTGATTISRSQQYFPAAAVSWSWRNNFEISVLGGKLRGGYKCFGGVCRNFPDFEGVRVDLIGRY